MKTMKTTKKWILLAFTLVMMLASLPAYQAEAAVSGQYTNPLMNGADPTIVRGEDGYFYSGFGTDNDIYIKRSETLLGLSTAESHLVYRNERKGDPDGNKNYYIWGPYIYRIDGAWYIYYSSSTENDFGWGHPSSYVLENTSSDPFKGEWKLKGKNSNIDDFDGNESEKEGLMNTESYGLACGIVTIAGERYFTYTKYEYFKNEPGNTKFNECPTIVKMENPWTLTGKECTVARPSYDWELHGDNVDEGAAVVEHGGKVYFAHSSSSFTNDNYCVGLSVCDLNACEDQDKLADYVMNENNWKKSTTPILSRSDENNSFGPGSPLFVKSPDETEDWLIYHAGPIGGQTATDRRVRAQKINWTDDGQINLGIPSNPNTVLDLPSGEIKTDVYEAEDARSENVTKRLFNNTAKASGSGYMKYDKAGGWVEFDATMSEEGTYALAFRYNNLGDAAEAKVSVNEEDAGTLSFGKNGTYEVDLNSSRLYNVSLKKGENKIRLTVEEASQLALDAMVITKTVSYDAKDAALTNGAKVEGDYVGGMFGTDAAITFTVNVPSGGYYAVDLRYADDHPANETKYATIYVNDKKAAESALFPTGGWNVPGNRMDNLYLKKGENKIAYVNHKTEDGGNTADVNYYSIAVSETVTNTYAPEADSTFNVDVESEAIYDVTFTYDSKNAGNATVTVNGNTPKQVPVTSGSSQTVTAALKLEAGENTLKFEGAEARSVYVSRRIPWRYQAENAELKDAEVRSNQLYYAGTGFAGDFAKAGSSVKFTANVPYSGTHTVDLRYSHVGEEDKTITLYINGQKVKQITLARTESLDAWTESQEEVYLRAGKNVVEYRVDEGDTGGINIDEIVIDRYATGATTAETGKLTAGEVYVIRDKNSSLSADIDGYSPDAGRRIHLWYYLGNNNQKWKLIDIGNGYWAFQGTYGSKRFSVKEDEIDGVKCYTAVTADVNNEDSAQQWKLERVGNYYKLINRKATEEADKDMVLSVYNDSKETDATLYLAEYTEGKDSQLFSVDGGIRSEDTGEVKEIQNEQSADDYAPNGSQYEVTDPVIPEKFDPSVTVKDGSALRYEAENAALEKGAVLATDHEGYSGNGFVGGMYNGDASITFKINVETAGNYTLALGYSYGFDGKGAAATYLNGTKVDPTPLPSSGNWDTWSESTFHLDLKKGVNTIVFLNRSEETGGLKGDANYDYLDVSKYPDTVAADETHYTRLDDGTGKRYEAEDAVLSGSAVESEHRGFSGNGYVGKMYVGSAKFEIQVAVEEAGEYDLQLGYANGHGDDVEEKCAAVFVNGKYEKAIPLPKTGSWGTWGTTESFQLKLNAGVSTIAFVNSSHYAGHAADVNYDYLDLFVKRTSEPANKNALEAALERPKGLTETDYTAASWAVLQEAVQTAEAVWKKEAATQEEVNAATQGLRDALEKLVWIDKSGLEDAIKRAKEKREADYTAASWAAMQEALAKANTVEANRDAVQEVIDQATFELNDAIRKLEAANEVNKNALKAAIERTKKLTASNYTAASWTAMQTALAAANEAVESGAVSQAEVDAATAGLRKALDELVWVDKSGLKNAIERAGERKEEDYQDKAEEWAAMQTALAEAETVYENADAVQNEVDAATDKLSSALRALDAEGTVNKNELRAAIDRKKNLKETDYTAASWAALQQALEKASEVMESETATQAEVNEATIALREAFTKLVWADKSGLKNAIERAGERNEANYTAASWAAMQAALEKAKAVAANADAGQSEIDQATFELSEALRKLETKTGVNKDALSAAIDRTKDLKETDYTAASWAALQEALKTANGAMESETVTQEEVNTAAESLRAAIRELARVDKSGLQAALDRANERKEEEYTKESWSAMQAALAKAKEVHGNANAVQKEIDAATFELSEALRNLKYAEPEKEALNSALNAAKALKKEDYTPEAWAAFQKALADAEAVFNNPSATKEQRAAAASALQKAIEEVKKHSVNQTVNPPVNGTVKVNKITISGLSRKIAAGKKVKLSVKVSPANAANKGVTWKSSNKKVATVNSAGVVTMKKNSGGKKVTITATARDGSKVKATYKITSMKGRVTKIAIKGKKTVKAGKSLKLKAVVKAGKKANKKLRWTTSNKKYATVSSSGKVKALKAGKGKTVKITAMATDGTGKKKSIKIRIK